MQCGILYEIDKERKNLLGTSHNYGVPFLCIFPSSSAYSGFLKIPDCNLSQFLI